MAQGREVPGSLPVHTGHHYHVAPVGKLTHSQLAWWGYEAVHEGCNYWFTFTECITLNALLSYDLESRGDDYYKVGVTLNNLLYPKKVGYNVLYRFWQKNYGGSA